MFMFLSAWQDHTNLCILVLWAQFSHTCHWMFNMTPSCQRTLRIWELELLLSTKMAEALRSSVTAWNWVTVQWPGSYRGFPRCASLGTVLARVDQRSWVLVLCVSGRSWLQKNRRMSAASIALEVAEVEGQLVSAQTILHTLQHVSLHGRRPRRKPLLKLAHKKACKTVCWRQPGQEHELLEPCPVVWWV